MKKGGTTVLILLTIAFIAFTAGFFFGRNMNSSVVSRMPTAQAPVNTDTTENMEHVQVITPTEQSSRKVNINTATVSELDLLPGIGPVLAQRIVDYRDANGHFTSIADLCLVEGIGSEKLMNLIELITVEGS